MTAAPEASVVDWLLEPATGQLPPEALVPALVERLERAGLALSRVSTWIPTKHPELWGNQIIWDRAGGCRVLRRSHEVAMSEDYVGTPAESLHASGAATLRCRLSSDAPIPFPMLRLLAEAGATDYLMLSLETGGVRSPWITFTTDRGGGFADRDVELLTELAPLLSLHVRLVAAHFATQSLLEVYLGANATRRVLEGQFRRGTGTEMEAVTWFCDMRGFTALGDRLPPREVVRILDRYFELVASPIEQNGGEVLKFIGDAILAVFPIGAQGPQDPCSRAIDAADAVLDAIDAWSPEHSEPIGIGVALHVGNVMYGNIGGRARLDFTVIGASVNEVCRVGSLCKELDSPLLMTAAFAQALGREDLVSLGRHALKGVREPQEILTTARARARGPAGRTQ